MSPIGTRAKAWLVTVPLCALVATACAPAGSGQVQDQTLTPSCSPPAAEDSGEFSVQVGQRTRTALVHVPAGSDVSRPPPLVLMFHGFGGSPQNIEAGSGMSVKADEAGFIVAYPAGLGSRAGWELIGTEDLDFVDALLTSLAAEMCFDPHRVYASGFSMGGGMTTAVGCRLADRIAAIAPVSAVNLADDKVLCQPSRPMPFLAFHGLLDDVLPYGGGAVPLGRYPEVIGAEFAAAAWAERNACESTPQPQPVINQTVEPMFWTGCAAPVELYRITNRGHTWPGSPLDESADTANDIHATDVIWEFFSHQVLPG